MFPRMSDQALFVMTAAVVVGIVWLWFWLGNLGRRRVLGREPVVSSFWRSAVYAVLELAMIFAGLWLYVWLGYRGG